ncbi:carbamoyltransferase C-terminal domain-containing protein [Stappia indica]|uniref:carbamoyltransferase C-terminal domain-containing protein n=1 Tax=Stappia indica TaxID=538381 RepID=UPI001CD2593F|nr:carbamoyltransferase C-terminal domain-containing protein [Stappia indica]MCA1298585.1 hypothetical protein [Stappia indica]
MSFKPGHDGHICLVENGRLVFSMEAEKDSWPRYEVVTPALVQRAMELCPDMPDVIAMSGWAKGFHSVSAPTDGRYFGWDDDCVISQTRRIFGQEIKYFASSHERSHIFCSFALSPFPQGEPFYALVWEGNIGSFYRVDGGMTVEHIGQPLVDPGNKYAYLYALADPSFPVGLGHFRFEDAGKLMALASYGSPGTPDAEQRRVIDRILEQDSILLTLDKATFKNSPYFNIGIQSDAFKQLARFHSDAIFERFHSFAKANLTEGLPLVISGGCGLNCDWNSAWKASGLFADVFVPPCTNDSGSAIGTAAEAQHHYTGSAKLAWSVYAGEPFINDVDDGEIDVAEKRALDLHEIAEDLARGHVIAWVQGNYEIGPRALGNRSLLASPLTKEMHARLNAVKAREGFRPIAPICLEEEVDRLFENDGASPHMLYFQKVKTDAIPAVTHVDGSARLQSVNRDDNPEVHALLSAFKQRTGYGVLCNTSLNFKGTGFINRLSDLHRYAVEHGLDGYVVGKTYYKLNEARNERQQLIEVA